MAGDAPRRLAYATVAVLAACVLNAVTSHAFADNPIVQTVYTTDPAPLAYDGKVYVYTGRDEDTLVNDFFTMKEWRVYSSSDMVNWTDHGSPLRYSDFGWSKGDAWAGQVVPRHGKFYYYIPTTSASLGRMAIGVAVSDSPIGPFEDALGKPLITENCGDIDPTVYVDDDGKAYLYWGNPNLCYVELNEDMLSYKGSIVHVPMVTKSFGTRTNNERPTTYEEGPWLYRRDDLYYLVFAAGPISEHIGYATSASPTGPWSYGGVIMKSQGASFTNHPGVVDFMGNSYFFYHNGALPGGGGFHRSVCVEQFSYRADGSWPSIDMTEAGPASIANLDPYVRTEAETIAWESGVETEPCSEGGMDVTSIDDGDSIKVESVDFDAGAVSFQASVASDTSGGTIELRLDREAGAKVGTCVVMNTGGPQSWATTSCEVSTNAAGVHDLFLVFSGKGGALFNFDWWRFEPRDPPDAGTSGVAGSTGGAGSMAAGASASPVGAGGSSAIAGAGHAAGAGGGVASRGQDGGSGIGGAVAPSASSSTSDASASSSASDGGTGCACMVVGVERARGISAALLLLIARRFRCRRREHASRALGGS